MRIFLVIVVVLFFIFNNFWILDLLPVNSLTDLLLKDVNKNVSIDNESSNVISYLDISTDEFVAFLIKPPYSANFINQSNSEDFISTKELTKNFESSVTINAGYFLEDFGHAGLLVVDDKIISKYAENDKQLTNLVEYFEGSLKIDNFENYKISSIKKDFAFQSGPLIIEKNKIRNDLIESSINGNTRHRRSVIGVTEKGDLFVLATKIPFELVKLAEYIAKIDDLKDDVITVINLDGGSSVSLYSKDFDKGVGENKVLPYLISFKPLTNN